MGDDVSPVRQRLAELDRCVERWRQEGRRVPDYRSEQEVCAALDRMHVRWIWADGASEHRLVLATNRGDGRPARTFCPDIYLPDYDTYLEVTCSGVCWENRRIVQPQTASISLKRHLVQQARNRLGVHVVLISGARYLRLTGRRPGAAEDCLHDLLRKYGKPRPRQRRRRGRIGLASQVA